MPHGRSVMRYSAVAALLTPVISALSQHCPSPDICYTLSVPATTAATGDGPIFLQLRAPATYGWVGLGQGTQMAGANIFVMYTSADGRNVTLSPRSGTGHVMPRYNAAAQVALLDGSGVRDGVMVANVRCDNCASWAGGKMDFAATGDGASWIWAAKSGSPLGSDDRSAGINQHSTGGVFGFDLAKARGGDGVNPFVAAGATSSATGPAATTTAAADGSTGGAGYGWEASNNTARMVVAHGVLASLAFVILFPAGAIGIRVLSFPGLVWLHAAVQCVAYLVFFAAFGLGIYLATDFGMLGNTHPRLGIFLVIILFFQPLLGYLHHIYFKRLRRRTLWSYAHLVLGRVAITLGMINGGLGLQLANGTKSAKIAYGVIAATVWLAYSAVAAYSERKRKRNSPSNYREIVPDSATWGMEMRTHGHQGRSSSLREPMGTEARSLSTGAQKAGLQGRYLGGLP